VNYHIIYYFKSLFGQALLNPNSLRVFPPKHHSKACPTSQCYLCQKGLPTFSKCTSLCIYIFCVSCVISHYGWFWLDLIIFSQWWCHQEWCTWLLV